MTIPAVGPILALTWALEVGDVRRFSSIKKAISYCGLCGAEKSSGDTMQRTPLSKQRNQHLQTILIEAAKMAPRNSPALAMIYDREKQKEQCQSGHAGRGAETGGVLSRRRSAPKRLSGNRERKLHRRIRRRRIRRLFFSARLPGLAGTADWATELNSRGPL